MSKDSHRGGHLEASLTQNKKESSDDIKGIGRFDDCEATLLIKCLCGHVTMGHGTIEQARSIKIAYCAKCGRGQRVDQESLQVINFKEAA